MSKLLKTMRDIVRSPWTIAIIVVIIVLFLIQYSSAKGGLMSGMTGNVSINGKKALTTPDKSDGDFEKGLGLQVPGETAPSAKGDTVVPSYGLGENSGPASAGGAQTLSGGVPSNCNRKPVSNPADLLPKDSNSEWAQLNPSGGGELANINLLKAGHHAGIDTIGSSLRNANLQVRSEPPNPHNQVSPWQNSTIEPDLMRIPLELGGGSL
jgi:hypothetical protein